MAFVTRAGASIPGPLHWRLVGTGGGGLVERNAHPCALGLGIPASNVAQPTPTRTAPQVQVKSYQAPGLNPVRQLHP